MVDWRSIGRNALVSGTLASVASTLALMAAAEAERKGALQPTNATSHWLNGPQAASRTEGDLRHTGVGYATHHAATVFWAALFEWAVAAQPPRGPAFLLRDALVVSAVAAAVDYGATPRRFTPGWEFVLSKRSMAAVYAAMGTGLVAGALIRRGGTRPSRSHPSWP